MHYLFQKGYLQRKQPSLLKRLYLTFIFPYVSKLTNILPLSLVTVHTVLLRYINQELFEKLGTFLMLKIPSKNVGYLILLFDFFPKGILLFCLMVDTFIFKELSLFYQFGSLLLFPLAFNYILFAISSDCLYNIKDGDNYVCIMNKKTGMTLNSFVYLGERLTFLKGTFDKTDYVYTFTEEFVKEAQQMNDINYTETLKDFMVKLNHLVEIYVYIKEMKKRRDISIIYFNFFLYLGYSITWTYIIFIVLCR